MMLDPFSPLFWSSAALALRFLILALALVLDWLFGDPDWLWHRIPHPVAVMGRWIALADSWLNRRDTKKARQRRLAGAIALAALVTAAATAGVALSWLGSLATVVVVAILLAARSLDRHVRDVAVALEQGMVKARESIALIVGRDTTRMDEGDIARAAIETAAENLSDGVVAPAFWFLVAGLPGILVYKLVNTADSMIGYRNARYLAFGWAAARLDDLLNLAPARMTGLLICLAAVTRGRMLRAVRIMLAESGTHASPNAGWPEAAMAGALDVWLAGPRRYGNRVRHAEKFNAVGEDADASAILLCLGVARLVLAVLVAASVLGMLSLAFVAYAPAIYIAVAFLGVGGALELLFNLLVFGSPAG